MVLSSQTFCDSERKMKRMKHPVACDTHTHTHTHTTFTKYLYLLQRGGYNVAPSCMKGGVKLDRLTRDWL